MSLEKNIALAKALKSIREFLVLQQAQLHAIEERIVQLEQVEQEQTHFDVLNILEDRVDNLELEQIPSDIIENIENNLEKSLTHLYLLEKQIQSLESGQTRFDGIEKQIQNLESGQTRFDGIEKQIQSLESGQVRFGEIDRQIQSLLESRQIIFDEINNKINELEKNQLAKLETRLSHFEPILIRLSELEKQIKNSEWVTQELAKVLPHAIRQAAQHLITEQMKDEEKAGLTESLQEPVELCLRESINADTRSFANILFPVMGPAIRKSINESLKNVVQSINKTAELSFSRRGLAWRLESWRSGRSFSEIVLQNSLVYRVEQVFLIHRESGLLIQHVYQKGVEIGDSDAVSAMFTAIQDFIRDSFSSSKTEELNSVEIGDYTVWLERGPYAVLACVIRGVAPYHFREIMRSSLEMMHAHYGLLLQNFEGDNVPLQPCLPWLERTLQSKTKEEPKTSPHLLSPQFIGIFGIILLGFLGWGYFHFEYQQRLTGYINELQKVPGIVIISSEFDDGKLIITGMRDPLASDPQKIAQNYGLSPEEVESVWTPYQDLTPQFVEQRLRQQLAPPSTVDIRLQDHILYLEGYASQNWINKATANLFAGVHQIVSDELLETDQFLLALAKKTLVPPELVTLNVQERLLQIIGYVDSMTFKRLQQGIQNLPQSPTEFAGIDSSGLIEAEPEREQVIQRIEKMKLYFNQGMTQLLPEQKTTQQALLKNVHKLLVLSQILQQTVALHITGSTDGTGSKNRNKQLSQQRAETIINWLHQNGIEKRHLNVVPPALIPFGISEPNPNNRNVIFRINY